MEVERSKKVPKVPKVSKVPEVNEPFEHLQPLEPLEQTAHVIFYLNNQCSVSGTWLRTVPKNRCIFNIQLYTNKQGKGY